MRRGHVMVFKVAFSLPFPKDQFTTNCCLPPEPWFSEAPPESWASLLLISLVLLFLRLSAWWNVLKYEKQRHRISIIISEWGIRYSLCSVLWGTWTFCALLIQWMCCKIDIVFVMDCQVENLFLSFSLNRSTLPHQSPEYKKTHPYSRAAGRQTFLSCHLDGMSRIKHQISLKGKPIGIACSCFISP